MFRINPRTQYLVWHSYDSRQQCSVFQFLAHSTWSEELTNKGQVGSGIHTLFRKVGYDSIVADRALHMYQWSLWWGLIYSAECECGGMIQTSLERKHPKLSRHTRTLTAKERTLLLSLDRGLWTSSPSVVSTALSCILGGSSGLYSSFLFPFLDLVVVAVGLCPR